jgi:ankyrin repeat protein
MMRLSLLMGCFLFLAAFTSAQEKRDPDGPESILKHLAKAFKDERTVEQIKKDNALIRAAAKGDADAIHKALQDGARINSRYIDGYAFLDEGESGYTALMFAVLNKRTDAIKLLLENKPDLEVKHPEGWTALYLAVTGDNKEAVDLLVQAGARQDPTKIQLAHELIRAACKGFKLRDGEGFPPYPGGISDGPPGPVLRELSKKPLPADQLGDPSDIVKVLDKQADINMPDPKGYTALMYAANLGLVENVKTLLAKGADAMLKSSDGETALSLAEREGSMFRREERRQVVKVLKEHLAKKP